ncbi:hypothetical protein ABZV91_15945 [Nocardia sp. NPDC004568]|uniref:hypothetical protein n=1 Tax=Nocardia sp. NPDC004568 TaxID=3154551 RepID=UPI0033B4FB02
MTRIGITGHIHLAPGTADLVRDEITTRLRAYRGDLVGVSCLAPGADTLFAAAVVAVGRRLEVILPARRYRDDAVPAEMLGTFDKLLARAAAVRVMAFEEPGEAAYRAANNALLSEIDRLLAVWDGGTGDIGSTAEAVHSARCRHIPVDIVWPPGSGRSAK